ncbi:MAG: selenocysteine-specific translation elongation factor [Pseudomonadota bacterium]
MSSSQKTCAIIVIGHVDHGKTSLVRAMTGMETDRLAEEKRRGLSISLGFAHKAYASGIADFIDAPGHEDFIRNMVAGSSGANAALLVVSGVDGVERQTREHLQIAHMLSIQRGVVAITKSDLSDSYDREIVREEVLDLLSGTPLEGAPTVFCSAMTGDGIEQLEQEIDRLVHNAQCPPPLPGVYLPVDRAFTAPGLGTVVTGTLLGGDLTADTEIVIEPSGEVAAVRGLHVHGEGQDEAQIGGRTAINLRGIDLEQVTRGDVVCAPNAFHRGQFIDIQLAISSSASRPLRHMEMIRVLIGTYSGMAELRLLDRREIPPGAEAFAQIRFENDLVSHAGQKLVIRLPSPSETIGGGRVIDPSAPKSKSGDARRLKVLSAAVQQDILGIAKALFAHSETTSLQEIARLTLKTREEILAELAPQFDQIGSDELVEKDLVADCSQEYISELSSFHAAAPVKTGMQRADLETTLARSFPAKVINHCEALLVEAGQIKRRDSMVWVATHDPLSTLSDADLQRLLELEAKIRAGGVSPPDLKELESSSEDRSLLAALVETGRVVRQRNDALDRDFLFHKIALEAAVQEIARAFPFPTLFKTGDARSVLNTSRKFIVPILEYLDREGVTFRDGDQRRIRRD